MLALNGMWAAKEANVERMVVFGSSCMYPVNGCQPFSEDALFTGILEPTSLAYATAKLLNGSSSARIQLSSIQTVPCSFRSFRIALTGPTIILTLIPRTSCQR